jgi:DNA-binding response OmpR family regulator
VATDPLELDVESLNTLDTRRRVLLVVAADALRAALVDPLVAAGFNVRALDDTAGLEAAIDGYRPQLVVLGDEFASTTGRQAALALRAHGATFSVPVAAVLELPSVAAVLHWLSVGVVDVWALPLTREVASRTKALLDECDLTDVQGAPAHERLLAFARRTSLSGTLSVYPGTPFEGTATFVDGALAEACLGPQRDLRALEQLVAHDEAPMEWVDASVVTQPTQFVPAPGHPTRVLVIEDVATIAAMVKKTLEHAGYQVDTAADGREGLTAALTHPYDLAVVDLNLPLLDGWGLLRQLRDDPVARECAVLVLSAHDELVETLRAARAGARAYLHKTGKAKELLDAAALLARPRAQAWTALSHPLGPVTLDVRQLGAVWTLRALAELDCAGRLVVEDELARYEVQLARGLLVSVTGQVGSRRVTGRVALELLLGARGAGRFTPLELRTPPDAPWVFDEVQAACDAVTLASRRRLDKAVANPAALLMNSELARLFARVATTRELAVMNALGSAPTTFEALVAASRQPDEVVHDALCELLRRGVLSSEVEPDAEGLEASTRAPF